MDSIYLHMSIAAMGYRDDLRSFIARKVVIRFIASAARLLSISLRRDQQPHVFDPMIVVYSMRIQACIAKLPCVLLTRQEMYVINDSMKLFQIIWKQIDC